jgi:dihydrofolate synthase/folylpolyglutamate synthase
VGRAALAEDLARALGACTAKPPGPVTTTSHPDPAQALRAALEGADPADRILVFGSFYTVGGVLKEGLPRLKAPHVG